MSFLETKESFDRLYSLMGRGAEIEELAFSEDLEEKILKFKKYKENLDKLLNNDLDYIDKNCGPQLTTINLVC